MDCLEARAGLWPPEQPRLAGDEVVEARAHVAACPECAEFFEQDRALLEAYDRVRDVRAPIEVRERVFDALAHARAGGVTPVRTPRWRKGLARVSPILAAAAVTSAVALWPASPSRLEVAAADGAMFVEDYLRRAVGQDHISTSDPDEVQRFLARELGMPVSPLALAGLELEGAEICLLEGRRGAMIVYKKDGASVSHYLVPREGTAARSPAILTQTAGTRPDMPVVTWSTPAMEQALVGELKPEDLLTLARAGWQSE